MNHMKYAPLVALLLNFWLPFDLHAGSCVWDPSGGSIAVDADVQVSAWPGDPAPDTGEFCDCDDEDNPVNWSPTGNYNAPLSGAVSGGKLDTATPGSKTVTANISYEYSCSVTGAVKWEDDDGNPWDKTFYVENYWIEGPSTVGKDEPASYEVKTNTGTPPDVTNWDTSGGSLSGSGASVSVTWSDSGSGKQVTATVDQYGDVFTYTDVLGNLVVEIELPDGNPFIAAKDTEITFRAKDPEAGSGQYRYKWDFGKGNPTHGGVAQKEVTGVKFGTDAEGEEHTVTLILTDVIQTNSGTATVNVIVPKFETETVADLPTDKTRSSIGIGEQVKVRVLPADITVDWNIDSSEASNVSPSTGTAVIFEAASAGIETEVASRLRAMIGGKPFFINFKIVPPNKVYIDKTFGNSVQTIGAISCATLAKWYIGPETVNFSYIDVAEDGCMAVANGYFSGRNGELHVPGPMVPVTSVLVPGKGWQCAGTDQVSSGFCYPNPVYYPGDFTWSIPFVYIGVGAPHRFDTVDHVMQMSLYAGTRGWLDLTKRQLHQVAKEP